MVIFASGGSSPIGGNTTDYGVQTVNYQAEFYDWYTMDYDYAYRRHHKTTCLQQVITGSQRAGYGVFCCAPSVAATDVLRQELGADAATLQQLLVSPKLQEEVRGRLLIVDEAGLISVAAMRDLCRLSDRQNLRLLLVGDTKQHTSVEARDALRCLQKYAQVLTVRLTEIRRQRSLTIGKQSPCWRRARPARP